VGKYAGTIVTGIIGSGICGYKINVEAVSQDGRHVKIKIDSECPNYLKVMDELHEVDAYREMFQKLHLGAVYQVLSKYIPHPSCPGLPGILKTVEVAAGIALPQTATMVISKKQT